MKLNSTIVKNIAEKIGFDECGISNTYIEDKICNCFDEWIDNGFNAEMNYLNNYNDVRKNPQLLVENAKSVISIILNYYSNETLDDSSFSIAKYAYGKDYHKVLKDKLYVFLSELQKIEPELNGRVFVDTAPLFERYFAEKSGLGFVGKNNCLINKNYGSWIFIGEIIVDVELDYDKPLQIECGNCSLCIDSCPTGALSERKLDAKKCISYHTIESKGEIPFEIKEKIETQVFGCDICQNVCPYNKQSVIHTNRELDILPAIKALNFEKLLNISDTDFEQEFKETSLLRAGRQKLFDNFYTIKHKK